MNCSSQYCLTQGSLSLLFLFPSYSVYGPVSPLNPSFSPKTQSLPWILVSTVSGCSITSWGPTLVADPSYIHRHTISYGKPLTATPPTRSPSTRFSRPLLTASTPSGRTCSYQSSLATHLFHHLLKVPKADEYKGIYLVFKIMGKSIIFMGNLNSHFTVTYAT